MVDNLSDTGVTQTISTQFLWPKIIILAYPADSRLCIVTYILRYRRNQESRGTERTLPISHKRPHHKVTVQATSSWLRVVLGAAEMDTNVLNLTPPGLHPHRRLG